MNGYIVQKVKKGEGCKFFPIKKNGKMTQYCVADFLAIWTKIERRLSYNTNVCFEIVGTCIWLTDWFARKNVDDTVIYVTIFITGTKQVRSLYFLQYLLLVRNRFVHYICYNIYYWYETGSFNSCRVCSPPIWKCILRARRADWHAI